MEKERKLWNEQQANLRKLLESPVVPPEAIDLFLQQHAALHSSDLTRHSGVNPTAPDAARTSQTWPGTTFADEVLQGLTDEQMRRIPPQGEHSIVWVWWHLARIEDVTMNMLVADRLQLAEEDNWFSRMGTPLLHTGNAMDVPAVQQFSAEIHIEALLAYRTAVGRRTEEIIKSLPPAEMHRPVYPARLLRVMEAGAVLEEARGIAEYWGRRDVAGLLLMSTTRHCFLHLNEAMRIKAKVGR